MVPNWRQRGNFMAGGMDPNMLAYQQRIQDYMSNLYNQALYPQSGLLGGMGQGFMGSPYSFMPMMQTPGPFQPTPTVMHPMMGGLAVNRPVAETPVVPQAAPPVPTPAPMRDTSVFARTGRRPADYSGAQGFSRDDWRSWGQNR